MRYILLIFLVLFHGQALAAEQIYHNDFDDQSLSGLFVWGRDWAEPEPPEYNLTNTGRGGSGYCFSSGTTPASYLSLWSSSGLIPNPWPTEEFYVSFWMRYPTYQNEFTNDNLKIFYPHWNGTDSYVHYNLVNGDAIYYSAKMNGSFVRISGNVTASGATDGDWHRYEFYVNLETGVNRFWFDGDLLVNEQYSSVGGGWTVGEFFYISAPSTDAEQLNTLYSRQVDDWELWDGMPDATCENYPSECTESDCEPNGWYWDTANEECLAEEPGTTVNGACGSNDSTTLSSLASGDSDNCSAGTVADFTGTGPWTWNCDGANGGTDDSCSASLASPVAGALRQGAFRVGGLPARFVEAQP